MFPGLLPELGHSSSGRLPFFAFFSSLTTVARVVLVIKDYSNDSQNQLDDEFWVFPHRRLLFVYPDSSRCRAQLCRSGCYFYTLFLLKLAVVFMDSCLFAVHKNLDNHSHNLSKICGLIYYHGFCVLKLPRHFPLQGATLLEGCHSVLSLR